jgi:tRNA threonylcarbamoyladenosine biosynthesis protein TsaB
MNLLALDTSTEYCSAALLLGEAMLERGELAGQRHSELLLPMLRSLLSEAKISIKDLDGIAFGAGPGSFTGLRIACGVAQGLAFGAGLKVAAVSTLMALAEVSGGERVIAALDARMGEIYCAAYERVEGEWREVAAPTLCVPQDAPRLAGGGWIAMGSGFEAHRAMLTRRYGTCLKEIHADRFPVAIAIARLGARMFARGEVTEAARAAPVYLRDKVAFTEQERQAMK